MKQSPAIDTLYHQLFIKELGPGGTPVRITKEPEDIDTTYSWNRVLFIETEPAEGVDYQWYEVRDGVEEATSNGYGGTTNAFMPDKGLEIGSYQYFCEVTKDGCTVRSRTVTYTVHPYPVTPVLSGRVEKVYDGATDVSDSPYLSVTTPDQLSDIKVTLAAASYQYETADAGQDKAVIASGITMTCEPAEKAKNVTLAIDTVTSNVGTITQAPLTITGADVAPRDYKEGNSAVKVQKLTFEGLVDGETLTIGEDYFANGTFWDENAGENKTVTVIAFLTDSVKAGNYRLSDPSFQTTGTISKATPTGVPKYTAISASGKTLADAGLLTNSWF